MTADNDLFSPSDRPTVVAVTDDLLDRYAGGEVTPVETEAVERWLDADPMPPARQERLARFQAVWLASRRRTEHAADTWNVDAAWRRTLAQAPDLTKPNARSAVLALHAPDGETDARVLPRGAWRMGGAGRALRAASLVALLGTGAFGWYLTSRAGHAPAATPAFAAREYVTARGERATFSLADGTRITLGAASKLVVPADYGRAAGDTRPFTAGGTAGPRLVRLEGEGYFEVTHDTARPFAVQAGSAVVHDIGTRFVVRAFGARQPVEVAVTEGEVRLQDDYLRRGDLGRLDPNGTLRVRRGIDLRFYTDWTQGRLVFDQTPLAEALPILERWYDLSITVADSSLYERRVFATFGQESVDEVLDAMALSLHLKVERRDRSVTLRRG